MRTLIAVLACAALLAGAAGCSYRRTQATPEGDATVTQHGAEVTLESEEGTLHVEHDNQSGAIRVEAGDAGIRGDQSVSGKQIGIPFYPGAKVAHSATMGQKDAGTYRQVLLTTPDSIDDVKAFYKKKYPEAKTAVDAQAPSGRMVQMLLQEGADQAAVQISREKDGAETSIMLHRGKTSE